jgi:hypothetical protein
MNPLIKKYKNEKRWLTWKPQIREGKTTKVPYMMNGQLAKSTDPNTWAIFDDIKSENKGIVLFDKKLTCIDIDHCLVNGEIQSVEKETITRFLLKLGSYVEISPSGTGLHCFFETKEPMELKANRKGNFEIYNSGRYMTFTGVTFGLEEDIKTLTPKQADEVLSILGYPWEDKEVKKIVTPSVAPTMADQDILTKMFNAKNGADIKALYEGSITKYNNDESSADLALCSHLAFWTGCNATQMENIWLGSPLGSRPKTIQRKDYRDRTIGNAIKNCKEVYKKPEAVVKKEEAIKELELLVKITDKGTSIIACLENITRILQGHEEFKGTIKYDEFTNVLFYKDKLMEDHHVLKIQARIQVLFSDLVKVSKDMVYDAMMKVARDNSFDSAIDYLRGLKWDGVSRIDNWLSETYNTPNDPLHKAIGSNWLKGLVKRIVIPGCKFDHVLVLEGEQGTKKSTSLMVLGRDWHVETTMSTDNKDFFMMFQGKAIIEFSEGETLSRTETKRMKAIITTQSDKYRPAYGRLSIDFKRRCVFAMTTNADEYLKDETGNRRWLPVKCNGVANVEWLETNRDQLFAEAYHRVIVKNETTWEFPDEQMKEAQELRRIHDPWEEQICEWYYELSQREKELGISVGEVYAKAIHKGANFAVKPIARFEEMNISDVLGRVLKLERRRSTLAGIRSYRYYPMGAPQMTMEIEKERSELKDPLKVF